MPVCLEVVTLEISQIYMYSVECWLICSNKVVCMCARMCMHTHTVVHSFHRRINGCFNMPSTGENEVKVECNYNEDLFIIFVYL
jgi:hypothetical protein